jgi:hypothetical protein
MSLIGVLVVVIIIGLLLWLVQQLPIAQPFKQIAMVVLIVICIIWLLSMLGGVGDLHIGRLRN